MLLPNGKETVFSSHKIHIFKGSEKREAGE